MKFKNILTTLLAYLSVITTINANEDNFQKFFTNQTLQIGYYLIGDYKTEIFALEELNKLNLWAGKLELRENDALNLGNFRFNVFDSATNKLIYCQGFNSLFEEWQSTNMAKVNSKAFYHVNNMPFPKHTIKYELLQRQKNGKFTIIHKMFINPNNYFIKKETPNNIAVEQIQVSGSPNNKIDIAFLAEGYTQKEMQKFLSDVKRIWEYFTTIEPFKEYSNRFNIYAVKSASEETGTDIPSKNTYKNTAFNFTFYTFNVERYLTSFDLKQMHKVAACVPYDYIFMVVNTPKYGGAGFYNYYSSATTDNSLSLKVAIHEFGHAFAGLADEYYDSSTALNDFYDLKAEPWEPNITTLANFSTKWKDLVSDKTPIPTPRTSEYQNKIGTFEGGGYVAKGIYSPMQDCRMKSNKPKGFCPVCKRAIIRVINYMSK